MPDMLTHTLKQRLLLIFNSDTPSLTASLLVVGLLGGFFSALTSQVSSLFTLIPNNSVFGCPGVSMCVCERFCSAILT